MALTSDEIQDIVSRVLSSLRTNSKTIDELSPVESLVDSDWFEVAGGKKVAFSVLRELIASASSTEHDNLRTLINKCELLSTQFEANETTATLTISSKGKTISCSVPIVSTNGAGFMTAADKSKLQSIYENLPIVRQVADDAKSVADLAQASADSAFSISEGDQLKTRMDDAEELLNTKANTFDVQSLQASVSTIREDISSDRANITLLQSGVNALATNKADTSEVERLATIANSALNSATVATQSVNAALTNSTEAKSAVTAMSSRVEAVGSSVESLGGRVGALEERVVFEEIASEAEWAARKEAGTLEAGKLYYVAEE